MIDDGNMLGIMIEAFLPQRAIKGSFDEAKFEERYGELFSRLEEVLSSKPAILLEDARYIVAFCMENIKSYHGTKQEYNMGKMLFAIGKIIQHSEKVPPEMFAKFSKILGFGRGV